VAAAAASFVSGHGLEALELYISEFGSSTSGAGRARDGPRLTASEASYRRAWLETVYETLRLRAHPSRAPSGALAFAASPHIAHQVAFVLADAAANAPHAARLDRALATRGASGGGARAGGGGGSGGGGAEAQLQQQRREAREAREAQSTMAPQWLPLTQLVLLTCKARAGVPGVRECGHVCVLCAWVGGRAGAQRRVLGVCSRPRRVFRFCLLVFAFVTRAGCR
jgi:hypothetical protein